MTEEVVTLLSDTETQPTPGMRAAMMAAEVGDEQKGEDPTVRLLQDRVAGLLGKEGALWLPSGTMCNLVAVKSQTQPGDAIVADWMAHVIRAESGGAALASGVRVEPIQTERGIFTVDELKEAVGRTVTVPPPYGQPVRLVCVEQTHNFGGGAIWPLDELRVVSDYARKHKMLLHMDGARLLNACVATGVPAADFSATVDSVWIDFTKGLGAPIGAVLAGTKDLLREARRYKQLFGGAMRQAGIAAAGCLYAMDHHVNRLAEDHEHARLLARGLLTVNGIHVHTPTPETNMVFFDVHALGVSNERFVDLMAASGVRMSQTGRAIRAVTHLDVSRRGIDCALNVVREVAINLNEEKVDRNESPL